MQGQIEEFVPSLNHELAAHNGPPASDVRNSLIPVINARPPMRR